jgi:uncharacterized MAPEG superfamily protein
MASASLNYPLLAIPAYYVFSLVPHAYAGSILASAGYKVNNANPKAAMSPSEVQGKVPDEVFQKYQRAENAHSNNTEQMPLFASAVLASLLAEKVIMLFMAVRAAYVVSYVQIADHSKSFIRSALWAIGSGLAGFQIYKAAQLMG